MARATSSFPVPLSPVMRTVRSLSWSRRICSTTDCIATLALTNPGMSDSRRRSVPEEAEPDRPSRAPLNSNPWRATAAIIRRRRATACPTGRAEATTTCRVPSRPPPGADDELARSVRAAAKRGPRHQRRGRRVATDRGAHVGFAGGPGHDDDRRIGVADLPHRRGDLEGEQVRDDGCIDQSLDDDVVGVNWRGKILSRRRPGRSRQQRASLREVRRGAEPLEDGGAHRPGGVRPTSARRLRPAAARATGG